MQSIHQTERSQLVRIPVNHVLIEGMLELPAKPSGLVLFAHGSGSSRHSPRNNFVARVLRENGMATLLMDLLRRQMPGADVAAFRFKAVRPTYDLHAFKVNGQLQPDGKTVKLWAQDHEGWLTMDAVATLR